MSKFAEALGHQQYRSNLYDLVKESLDEESFADFEVALRDRKVPHTVIAHALKSLGVEVSDNTIRRWRSKK